MFMKVVPVPILEIQPMEALVKSTKQKKEVFASFFFMFHLTKRGESFISKAYFTYRPYALRVFR